MLTSRLSSRYKEFYVCFHDDGNPAFTKLLRRGFQHVFVIEKTHHHWIVHEPLQGRLSTFVATCSVDSPFVELMREEVPGMTILRVVVKEHNKESLLYRKTLVSCVSMTEYLLGVRFGVVIEPYLLYKKLLKGHQNIISVEEL